jgi:hypothetical protein
MIREVVSEAAANACTRDAEGIAGPAGKDKTVAWQLAHCISLDIAELGHSRVATLTIPISEELMG